MVQKLKAWLLGVACTLTVSSTFAQTKIPASDPDVACGTNSKTYSSTFIPVYHTINCDMVERRPSEDAQGSLKAIAWDDRQSVWDGSQWYVESNVQVYVEDENGNSITFNAAADFAAAPDIVIGDDMNNPGQDYIIGLIYNTGDQYMYHKFYDPSSTFMVVVDYWHITNVGTSSLAATLLNTEVLSTRATSAPHIDMWTDSTQLINGWLPACTSMPLYGQSKEQEAASGILPAIMMI